MAECGLPYIPAINGELVPDCTLCITEPRPLFDPVIPIPPPPSFDFGCYPILEPRFTFYHGWDSRIIILSSSSSSSGYLMPNYAYMEAEIEYPNQATTGYCQPRIHMRVKWPTTKNHKWDACDIEAWPFADRSSGREIDPITGDPIEETDKVLKYCCIEYEPDCLMDHASGSRHGTIKQYANLGCDTLEVPLANRTGVSYKGDTKSSEGSEDTHTEMGYVGMVVPVCDLVISLVCDVYCDDDNKLKVAYRRLYFKRGILVKIDPYDIAGDFEEDDTLVECDVAPDCPIV